MPLEFSPEVPTENSPVHCVSIASVATRWLGCGEQIQIEIDDGLQRLRGGGIAQAVRQGLAPTGVFGLQSKQFQPRHRTSAAGGCAGRLADDSGSAARLAGLVDVGDSALWRSALLRGCSPSGWRPLGMV